MKTANRIVVILLLLAIGVVSTLALVRPGATFSFVEREAQAILRYIQQWPEGDPVWYVRIGVGVAIAGAIDLLLIFVIYLELRRPSAREIRVTKAEGGVVTLSVASIADRLKYEIDEISGVLRSRPRISGRRSGVVVAIDVETASGVDIPQKAGEIVEKVRSVVEDRMGLKLARAPRVTLRALPRPGRGKAAREEAATVPTEPPPWPEELDDKDTPSLDETQVSSAVDDES